MGGDIVDQAAPYPYQRGNFYTSLPIPAVPEHCIGVDAGPLRLVVESRELTNEILLTQLPPGSVEIPDDVSFDDFGASLHVCGAEDGLEHLRFDCFEHEPHYHYIQHAVGGNTICRIDEVAEGDPTEWTVGRLRSRLPEMLELCGLQKLAEDTRAHMPEVLAAVDEVVALLQQAQVRAHNKREHEPAGGSARP
jgi:hypothetical protein